MGKLLFEKPVRKPKDKYKGLQQKTALRSKSKLKSTKAIIPYSKSRGKVAKCKELRFDPPKKVGRFTPMLNDKCFFTDTPSHFCECHHVFFGNDRQKSETWGMKVWLRPDWHNFESYSAHMNEETALKLKQYAQREFEKRYDHEFFMEIFKENYL